MGKKRAYFADAKHTQSRNVQQKNGCRNLQTKPQDVVAYELRKWWDLEPEERYRLKKKKRGTRKKKRPIPWLQDFKTTSGKQIFFTGTSNTDYGWGYWLSPIAQVTFTPEQGTGQQIGVTLPKSGTSETWVLREKRESPSGTELIFENVKIAPVDPDKDPWESRIASIMDD